MKTHSKLANYILVTLNPQENCEGKDGQTQRKEKDEGLRVLLMNCDYFFIANNVVNQKTK